MATEFELFCYSVGHVFNSPADLLIDKDASPELREAHRSSIMAGKGSVLTNPILRVLCIFLSYITILPAALMLYKSHQLTKNYDVEVLNKSEGHIQTADRELRAARTKLLNRSRAEPADPMPLSTHLEFLNSLNRDSLRGPRSLDALHRLGRAASYISGNRDKDGVEELKQVLIPKVRDLKEEILTAAGRHAESERSSGALARSLDNLRTLPLLDEELARTPVNLIGTEGRTFNQILTDHLKRACERLGEITPQSAGQNLTTFRHDGENINPGDAEGSAASAALAWLVGDNTRTDFDPLVAGTKIHRSYDLGDTEFDFDDHLVGQNAGIETNGYYEEINEGDNEDLSVSERYLEILENIDEGDRGIIETGETFFAVVRNEDGSIAIFDPHGSEIGVREGIDSASYEATFATPEDAAAFLSAHKNPFVGAVNHPIRFNPVDISDNITMADLYAEGKTIKAKLWRCAKNMVRAAGKILNTKNILSMFTLLATMYYVGGPGAPQPTAYPVDPTLYATDTCYNPAMPATFHDPSLPLDVCANPAIPTVVLDPSMFV